MLKDMWNAPPGFRPTKSAPSSPAKPLGVSRTRSESFHITHKVPVGDTPYVRAKNVQLVDKDPEKAIPLFWAAINAGDRVDSALKDMAIVMKQQNRAEEAIEAIKSLRHRCSDQAQESLDNILLDLYKRCGRLDDQIALLRHKLFLIQQGMAFNGKRTKTARPQSQMGREVWTPTSRPMSGPSKCSRDLESEIMNVKGGDQLEQSRLFDTLLGSSSIWQPQPCKEQQQQQQQQQRSSFKSQDEFPDENINNSNIMPNQLNFLGKLSAKSLVFQQGNSLNIDAPPFYLSKFVTNSEGNQFLKRTRSGNAANSIRGSEMGEFWKNPLVEEPENKTRRRSVSPESMLPDSKDFEEAILAAVLGSGNEVAETRSQDNNGTFQMKIEKRLRVFQDITQSLSPRA
ncbi:tetratricopeptide repeat (TPR)-like superfamily protein [Actinidia rufa]|uniref:Tetratricopeptide repeat (TPR)-like superfamily protein n=1 Tax=Actinidia rufa TaxID=165716 RepID=A0A7J0EN55_9ERIC|nr:tetratricopeptide repeat (TPR)-like superfamily protein [Actinidia rufa]